MISSGILIMGQGLFGTLLPVRAELEGFATLTIGLFGSLFYIGFAVGCLGVPYIVRRTGHIRAFAILAAIAAITPLLHVIGIDAVIWSVLRAVLGFCVAGMFMVMESWLNERSTNETRGQVLSIYVVINYAAMTVGQLSLDLDDPGGFVLFNLASIIFALALVPICLTKSIAPTPPATIRIRLRRLYRTSPVGLVGCFVVGAANAPFWTLAPAYVTGIFGDADRVATFMAVAVVGGAISQWPLGRTSDLIDRRYVIAFGCLGGAVAGFGLAFVGDLVWALYLFGFLFCALGTSQYAICVAHANDYVEPTDVVEASSGLLLAFAAGASLGPFAASVMMSLLGVGGLFIHTAILHLLLVAFVAYRMGRRAARPAKEREHFVMMEPRSTPSIFELDPRAERAPEREPDDGLV
jgi:MFS family permease